MQQLLLLAAQLAGVEDIFRQLVPKWALKALFERVTSASGQPTASGGTLVLSRIRLQDFFREEEMPCREKSILAFFLKAATGEAMTQNEFVSILVGENMLYHSTYRRLTGARAAHRRSPLADCAANECQGSSPDGGKPANILAAVCAAQRPRPKLDEARNQELPSERHARLWRERGYKLDLPDGRGAQAPANTVSEAVGLVSDGILRMAAAIERRGIDARARPLLTPLVPDTSEADAPRLWRSLRRSRDSSSTRLGSARSCLDRSLQCADDVLRRPLGCEREGAMSARAAQATALRSQAGLCPEGSCRGPNAPPGALQSPPGPRCVHEQGLPPSVAELVRALKAELAARQRADDPPACATTPCSLACGPDATTTRLKQADTRVRSEALTRAIDKLAASTYEAPTANLIHHGKATHLPVSRRPSFWELAPERWAEMKAQARFRRVPAASGASPAAAPSRSKRLLRVATAGRRAGGGQPAFGAKDYETAAAMLTAHLRLRRTKRLRVLFEEMDTAHTGLLSLQQIREYLVREAPGSLRTVATLFDNMTRSKEGGPAAAVSFVELLKVFFPETSEAERRQLAKSAPPTVRPVPALYDELDLGLLGDVFEACCPRHAPAIPRSAGEAVRQLLGKLGMGDLAEDERDRAFDMVDLDADGKISYEDLMLYYLNALDDNEEAMPPPLAWSHRPRPSQRRDSPRGRPGKIAS